MIHANQEQLRDQETRRELLRHGIISHLSAQPRLLKLWTAHQPIDPSMRQPEPESVVAVVNLDHLKVTSVRIVDYHRLRRGDTQWLKPENLRCPTTGKDPEEATIFSIMAEPALKAVALTPKGWNGCWVLQQVVDDEEDNDLLSVLKPIKIIADTLGNIPYKPVFTSPSNLVTPRPA